MKKYVFITAVFTACLALCAAVWPQSKEVEEAPVPIHTAAVNPVKPATTKDITMVPPEEEKMESQHSELVPEEAPPIPEPEFTQAPAPSQAVTDSQPNSTVYVPGFGWLESQGEGTVTYAEDMYENGNKVGIMG